MRRDEITGFDGTRIRATRIRIGNIANGWADEKNRGKQPRDQGINQKIRTTGSV
jgi:hypothetical protein